MDYSKYPHAREYYSQSTGRKVCGLSVKDHVGHITFFVFDEEEPYLTEMPFVYDSSEAFEEEWSEATSEPSILLDGSEIVTLFRKWQGNGYYTPKKEYVEALVYYAKKLEEYNASLERENAMIYGKLMGVDIYPNRKDSQVEEA